MSVTQPSEFGRLDRIQSNFLFKGILLATAEDRGIADYVMEHGPELDKLTGDSYGDNFKELTGELMRAQDIRNSLAHQRRDPLESYITERTQSGPKKTFIDERFVFGFVKEAQETIRKLRTLQSLIEVEGPSAVKPPDQL